MNPKVNCVQFKRNIQMFKGKKKKKKNKKRKWKLYVWRYGCENIKRVGAKTKRIFATTLHHIQTVCFSRLVRLLSSLGYDEIRRDEQNEMEWS